MTRFPIGVIVRVTGLSGLYATAIIQVSTAYAVSTELRVVWS